LDAVVNRDGYSVLRGEGNEDIAWGRRGELGTLRSIARLGHLCWKMMAAVELHYASIRHLRTCPDCNNGGGTCTDWNRIELMSQEKLALAMDAIRTWKKQQVVAGKGQ
jgi:hypothetical protein